jgi:hypothetical protein
VGRGGWLTPGANWLNSNQFLSDCAAVEEKVGAIMSAAEDALMTLKHECKRLLVLLPAKVLCCE